MYAADLPRTPFKPATKKIASLFCFKRKVSSSFPSKFVICGDMLLAEICAPKRNLAQRLAATAFNFISFHLTCWHKAETKRRIKPRKFICSEQPAKGPQRTDKSRTFTFSGGMAVRRVSRSQQVTWPLSTFIFGPSLKGFKGLM